MRTITLTMTVNLRQLTKEEVEDMGESWSEFKDDRQGAVDAIEPSELAEAIEGHLGEDDYISELLAGSEIMAGISKITVASSPPRNTVTKRGILTW